MLSSFLTLAAIGFVAAAPAPQDIDFDLAYALPNPTFTEAVGATAQVVTYNPTTILSAAAAQITASNTNTDVPAATTSLSNQKRGACSAQPLGAGPIPSPDTASAFAAYAPFAQAATGASPPSGYVQQFVNLNGSNNAYGYLGFTTLKTYDVASCAAKCNAINGCISINIYYERDPTVDPGTGNSGCANPPSTTMIKCVFWGGPISADNAVNTGQWRNQFQVVIAGSNGYTNSSVAALSGYSAPIPLGNAAINAPYDKYGYNTYMGDAIFLGAFNASLCAAACSQKSAYNLQHPSKDGSPVQTCQFFNTYILYINDTTHIQGQYCAMYSESWPQSYATNVGQYRGSDHFLIEYSFAYSNNTNPGAPCASCAVAQATRAISYSTLQPFCSSYLGYSAASVSTQIATVSTDVTSTVTATVTPTTYVGAAKRALSTPSALAYYPSDILSSACSLEVTPAAATATTTSTTLPVIIATTTTTTSASPIISTLPANLLVNGNFSTNQLAPWVAYDLEPAGAASVSVANNQMYQHYYNDYSAGPYARVYVEQAVTLVPGYQFTLSFDYNFDNTDQVYLSACFNYDAGGSQCPINQAIPQNGQTHVSVNFVASGSSGQFSIGATDVDYQSSGAHMTNFVLALSPTQP